MSLGQWLLVSICRGKIDLKKGELDMADETKTSGQLQTIADPNLHSYSRSCESKGEGKVLITHLTTCSNGQAYHAYTMDLSNLTEAQLYEHAARNLNIQSARPKIFRKDTAEHVVEHYDASKVVDIAPWCESKKKTPRERQIDAMVKGGMERKAAEWIVDNMAEAEKIANKAMGSDSDS